MVAYYYPDDCLPEGEVPGTMHYYDPAELSDSPSIDYCDESDDERGGYGEESELW